MQIYKGGAMNSRGFILYLFMSGIFFYPIFIFSGEVHGSIRRAVWADDHANEKFLAFLERNKETLHTRTMYGRPFLHACVAEGAVKLVRAILKANHDALYVREETTRDTVLHVAIAHNIKSEPAKAAMIQLLLEHDTAGILRTMHNRELKTAHDLAYSGTVTRYEGPQGSELFGGGVESTESIATAWPSTLALVAPHLTSLR